MDPKPQYRTELEISEIMRKVSSKDTKPEMDLRKALWSKGIRYRLKNDGLPGKPDLVIPSVELIIFVDGDYWHAGQWVRRGLTCLEDQFANSKSQKKEYWIRKIRGNLHRDLSNTANLLSEGWKVLRLWESDLANNLANCVQTIENVVKNGTDRSYSGLYSERTVAEFFAGVGLARIGLEKAGWQVRFANDIDVKKYDMYKAHFQGGSDRFILGDVHKLSQNLIPQTTLATASFPCNDLSLAGSRKGLGAGQSSAFWGFMGIIEAMKEKRPKMILLENVPGFLSSHKGADFYAAVKALNKLGYSADPFFLDASKFTPQSRLRLFVVATMDESIGIPGFHGPECLEENELRPRRLTQFIQDSKDLNWRLRQLPIPEAKDQVLENILEDLPEVSSKWWSQSRAEYLLSQMSPRHRETAESMINRPSWSYGAIFRRVRNKRTMAELRVDGIAGCLRTPRGGSGRQILFKAGFGRYYVRLFTPRECARLMGADDYRIDVPDNQAFFGFGDGVCVAVIEWIANYYLNPVASEMIRGRVLQKTW